MACSLDRRRPRTCPKCPPEAAWAPNGGEAGAGRSRSLAKLMDTLEPLSEAPCSAAMAFAASVSEAVFTKQNPSFMITSRRAACVSKTVCTISFVVPGERLETGTNPHHRNKRIAWWHNESLPIVQPNVAEAGCGCG